MPPCLSSGLQAPLRGQMHTSCRLPSLLSPLRSRAYSSTPPRHGAAVTTTTKPTTPYSIARNTRGSLPVYSDIRNGGTRYLVLIKNIRGNIHSLRDDLSSSLFVSNPEKAARLKTEIARPDTLVVTGGRWKHDVTDWLRRKGF